MQQSGLSYLLIMSGTSPTDENRHKFIEAI